MGGDGRRCWRGSGIWRPSAFGSVARVAAAASNAAAAAAAAPWLTYRLPLNNFDFAVFLCLRNYYVMFR